MGANFTSLWLAIARQGAFDHAPHAAPRPGEIVAAMCGNTAKMAEILSDGIVTPDEVPAVMAIAASKASHASMIARMAVML
ncbi:MAG: hypothetical protein PGN12_06105 [Sphingomonas phyllosphaerae]